MENGRGAETNDAVLTLAGDFARGLGSNIARRPLSTVFFMASMPAMMTASALTLAGIHEIGLLKNVVSPHADAITQSLLGVIGLGSATVTALRISDHIKRGRELLELGAGRPFLHEFHQAVGDFARGLQHRLARDVGTVAVFPVAFGGAGLAALYTKESLAEAASSTGYYVAAPIVTSAVLSITAASFGLSIAGKITDTGEFIRLNRVRGADGKWNIPTSILKEDEQGYVYQALSAQGDVVTQTGKNLTEDLQDFFIQGMNRDLKDLRATGARIFNVMHAAEIDSARKYLTDNFVAQGHFTAQRLEEMIDVISTSTAFFASKEAAPAPAA